jgi:hypothetical protein
MKAGQFLVRDRDTGRLELIDGLTIDHDGRGLLGIHHAEIDGRLAFPVTHISTGALICATDKISESVVIAHRIIEIVGAAHPMAWSSNRLAASEYLREAIMVALLSVRADYYLQGRWKSPPTRSTEA